MQNLHHAHVCVCVYFKSNKCKRRNHSDNWGKYIFDKCEVVFLLVCLFTFSCNWLQVQLQRGAAGNEVRVETAFRFAIDWMGIRAEPLTSGQWKTEGGRQVASTLQTLRLIYFSTKVRPKKKFGCRSISWPFCLRRAILHFLSVFDVWRQRGNTCWKTTSVR